MVFSYRYFKCWCLKYNWAYFFVAVYTLQHCFTLLRLWNVATSGLESFRINLNIHNSFCLHVLRTTMNVSASKPSFHLLFFLPSTLRPLSFILHIFSAACLIYSISTDLLSLPTRSNLFNCTVGVSFPSKSAIHFCQLEVFKQHTDQEFPLRNKNTEVLKK